MGSGTIPIVAFELRESGKVRVFGAGLTADPGDDTILGIFDLSVQHEFKFVVKPDGAVQAFIDGGLEFNGTTTIPAADTIWLHVIGATPAPFEDGAVIDDVIGNFNLTAFAPTEVILDDFIVRKNEVFPELRKPENVFADRRENFVVVSWDQVTRLKDGTKLSGAILRYDVFRFDNLNETDIFLKSTITTINEDTKTVDTVFIDTNEGDVHSYRIRAVAIENGDLLESDLSEKATSVRSTSQIDDKEELLDRKLFVLGKSKLGSGDVLA